MKKLIYIFITIVLVTSCKDFLDVTPTGVVIPHTVEQYDLILKGISNINLSEAIYMDPDVYPTRERRSAQWPDDIKFDETSDMFYDAQYEAIYKCNVILENIDNAPLGVMSEDDRKMVKRNAIAERALLHWLLVNQYAPAYNPSTASTDITVPLNTTSDVAYVHTNATVKQIYDFIIAELKTAYEMVDDEVSSYSFSPSKPGVAGLLAKVYMSMSEYDTAFEYADEALKSYSGELYDISNCTVSDISSVYGNGKGYSNLENIWHRTFTPSNYLFNFGFSLELTALYDTENDARYVCFTRDNSTLPVGVKEYIYGTKESNILVSVANMLLVRAECNAHADRLGDAIDDVNAIRAKRIKSTALNVVLPVPATKSEALDVIREERRRELAFSGQGLYDLKRYYVEGREVPTFTRVLSGVTYTLKPGSTNYYQSIAPFVLIANPNIVNNK